MLNNVNHLEPYYNAQDKSRRVQFANHYGSIESCTFDHPSAINYVPMAATMDCAGQHNIIDSQHLEKRFQCFFGCCHVVNGTKIFLVLYVVITVFGLMFGMVSAFVWTGIPILITSITIYALHKHKHKYLYPFLIISVVQLVVCLVMTLVIVAFAIANYETLKLILSHSLNFVPSPMYIVAVVGITVSVCFLLAFLHLWQITVIYRCLQYFEFAYHRERHMRLPQRMSSFQSERNNVAAMSTILENNLRGVVVGGVHGAGV
ncbi:hypothetical protein QR680_002566 [Steinernema hermaphroditum]|uniref:Uncharacterized protein n=1 Tax=Steinernema hermaphroditum TaxID=289476 RepID=A0AA39LIH7_9BILA|nr:hypothetical protein QR680_002566 [Steinernema hermaphroditum]